MDKESFNRFAFWMVESLFIALSGGLDGGVTVRFTEWMDGWLARCEWERCSAVLGWFAHCLPDLWMGGRRHGKGRWKEGRT